jgi:hypothetical protein
MMETWPGARLDLLLAGFTTLVDEVSMEVERNGYPGVTATHEFALRVIDSGVQSASIRDRSLRVSTQPAAKTIAAGPRAFDARRTRPEKQVGLPEMDSLEKALWLSRRGSEPRGNNVEHAVTTAE